MLLGNNPSTRPSSALRKEDQEHCWSPTKRPPAGHSCECLCPHRQKPSEHEGPVSTSAASAYNPASTVNTWHCGSSIAFSGVCQQFPNDIDIDAIDWSVHSPTLDSNQGPVGHHVSHHSLPPYNTTDPDPEWGSVWSAGVISDVASDRDTSHHLSFGASPDIEESTYKSSEGYTMILSMGSESSTKWGNNKLPLSILISLCPELAIFYG